MTSPSSGEQIETGSARESDLQTISDAPSASPSSGAGAPVVRELDSPLRPLGFGERYEAERALGAGGMGEVSLCTDAQIGRRVAMKQLASHHRGRADLTRRFVREARVQARLEHPSILPVYELGTTPQGELYFTMKRLRGVTLAAVFRELDAGEPEARQRYTERRLLRDFSRVCQVVAFAHDNEVVHRDVKPANIMLGEYGEVYLLDWGIALTPDESREADDSDGAGKVLGTMGYMAPEQIRDPDGVTSAADVFSLGCVLYELLCGRRAILADGVDIAVATLDGVKMSPSARAPNLDVPPELDRLCMEALHSDPNRRPTARDLHERIEKYLDGERDRELRTNLARENATAGAELLASLRQGTTNEVETRREALRAVGRALALDPSNATASAVLMELLTQPPRHIPEEVEQAMAEHQLRQRKRGARIATFAYPTLLLYVPLFIWAGIRTSTPIIVYCVLAIISSLATHTFWKLDKPGVLQLMVPLFASTAAMATSAALFGPLVVTPGLVAVNVAAFAMSENIKTSWFIALVGIVGVTIPLGLQWAGIVPQSYRFVEGGMLIESWALELSGFPAIAVLCVAAIASVITAVAVMSIMRQAQENTQLQLELQTWQIRQLVP